MHAKNLFINQRAHRQVLKCLAKFLPNFGSVFVENAFARFFEAVYLVYKSALVVSAQHGHVLGVPELVGK